MIYINNLLIKITFFQKNHNWFIREEKRKEAEEEANILKSLDHMSIVKFVTTSKFDFGMGEYFGLVMENCEGGNLARYLGELVESKKKATDNEILRWVTQLVMALG